jgi:formylglycine-generating enzyme required for sulfatase activity
MFSKRKMFVAGIVATLLIASLFVGCGKQSQGALTPAPTQFGTAVFKLAVAANSPFAMIAKTITLTISASDMNTLTRSLTKTDSTVTGTVTGIPAGKNRLFRIDVYDSANVDEYTGSATADIAADDTVPVNITVVRKSGAVTVNGTVVEDLGIVMKDIPAGTFTMGSSDPSNVPDASPPHQVTLSAFKMSETDVTQEQYLAVMGTNPSYFDTGTGASLRPVESVTWFNAVQFCNALSKLSGLDTVYNTTTWAADFSKSGYSLPTEAQWEYACRAGSTTEYWWGPDTNGMGARTWSVYNSGLTTQPVATKLANAYGLYDMTGNVWQWCNDWHGAYTAGAATDPTGASTSMFRVLRGGSWGYVDYVGAIVFRSAFRLLHVSPGVGGNNFGFRVVLPR